MNYNIDDIKQRYNVIGHNERLLQALQTVLVVAPSDLNVLIQGESGTGKEVLPRIIHDHSPRKTRKFLAINCGSIPEGTIDSELFGHEKGAFTDAVGEHAGYFETANEGTLFLDEVGELPLSTQARLLRVLESGEFMRVGSNRAIHTNVRVVAATNVNMQQAIRDGRFRADLYYRLCGVTVALPPLRERGDDVLKLFRHFAITAARANHISESLRLSREAEQVMLSYPWPGNIRQLRNVTEQLTVLYSHQSTVTPEMLFQCGITDNSTDIVGPIGQPSDTDKLEQKVAALQQMVYRLYVELQNVKTYVGFNDTNGSRPDSQLPIMALPGEQMISHPQVVEPYMQPTPSTYQDVADRTSDYRDVTDIPSGFHEVTDDSPYRDVTDEVEEVKEDNYNLEQLEKETIERALRKYRNRRNRAAEELGISQRTLYRKIKQYDIDE